MTRDPDHARMNARRPNPALQHFTRALAVSCAIAALFAGPLRAEAGQPGVPLPTPPESSVASATHTSAPVMQAGAAVPAPRVDDNLSLTGRALWDGLQDQRVSLKLINGAEVVGMIVAHSGADIAIARASDGSVVSVPKAEVAGVRTRAQTIDDIRTNTPAGQRPIDNGHKLYGGGVALLSFGAPFSLAGTVMLGLCPGCLYIHLPLLLPGIAMLAGGSVAIKRAKQRDRAFRQAWGIPVIGRMQLTPSLAFTRAGGEVGFALRF